LIASIRATLGTIPPAAVVIDTLNRSLAGFRKRCRDMAAYVKAADAIRDAFNCAVIIVHHCGHEGTRPRGHSSLIGAVDAQIAVKRDTARTISSQTIELMKDGSQGDEFNSRLEVVDVGIDDDGDPINHALSRPSMARCSQRKRQVTNLPKGADRARGAARGCQRMWRDSASVEPYSSWR